jgi:4-amino-4-deoxy-L-arabinose transferase-like glycosyltransferase
VTPPPARGQARAQALLLLAIAGALLLPSVWTRDLWFPDEPRYAETSREMVLRGDFILPHLNGEPYFEKPPLFFWLTIAIGAIPGVPPGTGGRLVTVLSSAGVLLLTWRLGAVILGKGTGILASLLLATSLLFWLHGQTGVIDPLLTFFCTLAFYAYARHRRGDPRAILLFYASCSLGILAKGPVALLIPSMGALAFSLISDGRSALKARHALWGVPLALTPVALWLAAGAVDGGAAFAETMIFKQNLGRMVNAFIHREPPHFFVLAILMAVLPWTVFLPQALLSSVKERIGGVRPLLLPLVWFATGFLFFSIMSGKKTRYMLPLLPAASLLVAGWLVCRHLDGTGRIRRGRPALLLAASAGLIVAGAFIYLGFAGTGALPVSTLENLRRPGSEESLAAVESALAWPASLNVLIPAAVFGLLCATAIGLAIKGRGEALTVFLSGWLLLLVAAGILWAPVLNEAKSARGFADEIRERVRGSPVYSVLRRREGALNFYLPADRLPVLRLESELRHALAEPGARFIGSEEDLQLVERMQQVSLRRDACRRVGGRILCLASIPRRES